MTGQRLAAAIVAAGLAITGCTPTAYEARAYTGTWGDEDVFTCVDVAKDTQRCMGVRIDWTYTSEYGSLVNHDFSPAIGRALKEIEPWETPADIRAHIARTIRGGFGDSARFGVAVETDGALWTATKAATR